jgi:MFS family permease
MTLFVVAPQLLAQWFAGREIGIAMGVFNTGVPTGTILSLNLLSLLAENLGWRVSIWFAIGLSLVALVIFVLAFAPAPGRSRQASLPSEGLLQSIRLTGVPIWLVGSAWLLFNATMISMFTFTPDLLKAAGFSVATAGFLTSIVMWPALVLSPLIGYATDKIDHKRAIISFGSVTVAALMIWVPVAIGWILALIVLIGIVQALVPAPVFALAPEVISPQRLGVGFGVISTCLNLGVVVGPAVVGLLKDVTGSYQASYALMSGFALLIPLTMVILSRWSASR